MKTTRKRCTGEFKAKVALEAIRGDLTLAELAASLSIVAQCRLVSISRSSFYYAPVAETAETLALMAVIDAAFLDHPWYGSRQRAGTFGGSGMQSGDGTSGG